MSDIDMMEIDEDQLHQLKLLMQKMLFVYNALCDGWTVKMVEKDKFEFKKSRMCLQNVDFFSDDFLKNFVNKGIRRNGVNYAFNN